MQVSNAISTLNPYGHTGQQASPSNDRRKFHNQLVNLPMYIMRLIHHIHPKTKSKAEHAIWSRGLCCGQNDVQSRWELPFATALAIITPVFCNFTHFLLTKWRWVGIKTLFEIQGDDTYPLRDQASVKQHNQNCTHCSFLGKTACQLKSTWRVARLAHCPYREIS